MSVSEIKLKVLRSKAGVWLDANHQVRTSLNKGMKHFTSQINTMYVIRKCNVLNVLYVCCICRLKVCMLVTVHLLQNAGHSINSHPIIFVGLHHACPIHIKVVTCKCTINLCMQTACLKVYTTLTCYEQSKLAHHSDKSCYSHNIHSC